MNTSARPFACDRYDFDMHHTTLKECGGMDMYAMCPALVVAAFHNGSLAVADDVIETYLGIAKIIAQDPDQEGPSFQPFQPYVVLLLVLTIV